MPKIVKTDVGSFVASKVAANARSIARLQARPHFAAVHRHRTACRAALEGAERAYRMQLAHKRDRTEDEVGKWAEQNAQATRGNFASSAERRRRLTTTRLDIRRFRPTLRG